MPFDFDGKLSEAESFWGDRYEFLHSAGYTLRPRYKPGWSPSWKAGPQTDLLSSEDAITPMTERIMDAVRTVDGKMVVLKKVLKSVHPHEAEIGQYLTSPPLSSDPRNHCCPILDVLQDPLNEDMQLIVMPLLRRYKDPKFETVGEALEFFHQGFEGLYFMHMHHIAHRDCMTLNIMMDASPMYPKMYHPQVEVMTADFTSLAKYYTRTARPTRYYWTDFGLSLRFSPDDPNPVELPIWGGDRTVPEFRENFNIPRNQFHADVYCMGNLIREDFLQPYSNLEFMNPLITSMVNPEPGQRPTMEQVVTEFQKLVSDVPSWRLRSRLIPREEGFILGVVENIRHIVSRAVPDILRWRRPIPKPKALTS